MKKLNRLFAILIAVLGVSTLSAQTNIIADWDGGSNTGKPTTFGWASSNSSRSWTVLNTNSGARVVNNYSGYKKEDGSAYSYVKDSEPSTQILWIRYNSTSETYTYKFQGLEAGKVYTFSGLVGWHNNSNAPTFTITVNGDKELAKVSKYCGTKQRMYPFSVDFMVPADNQSTNFTLKFNCNQGGDCMEALSALSIVENTAFANASQENPYDMTSWLKDAGFEEATGGAGTVNTPSGWTIKHSLSGWLDGTPNTTNPSEGSKCYNLWAGTVNSIDMYQTVTLPAGKYTVYADLRTDGVDKITNQGVYASVAGVITKSGTITNVADPWNSKEGWNTLSATFNNASEGEVIIGISSTGNGGSSGWFQADNVRLFYLGFDLTEANNALNALIETAQGIVSANEASPKSIEALNTAIAAGQSVAQNKEAIEQAAANLTVAINAANATVAACNEYRTMLALSESMYTNSTANDKSTFEAAINKAKSDFNAAISIDVISAIVTDLQNAQKVYCLVAAPTEGHPFDMTFLVVNPWLDEGTKGWTFNTGAPNNGIATNQGGAITGNYFENWKRESYTGDIYQELTGLPKGKYVLTAAAFRDQLIDGASDGDAVYVFANEAETLVDAATPAFYSVEVTTTTGTLTFGVRSKVAKYRWMGIDNVTLQFVAGLDLSEFTAAYNAALEAAIAARDNAEYSKVGGAEKAALLAAIAMTPEQTQESLNNATDALVSATSAFIAAKGDYDKLSAEILVAQGLGMTDEQIADVIDNKIGSLAYTDLKVAEYSYVKTSFNYDVALSSEWTKEGPVGELSNQHWSGENRVYMEQSGSAWSASSWKIKYDQDLTLPAGKYVFKVAGRKASGDGCTLSLIVTNGEEVLGTVNDFPEGDTGLGINKKGETSFDANDEAGFANNNAGRGWQWRYVKFTLASEATVNIAVNAEATTNHQWISFCDATVQMTEETYLEANKDGLNAAIAAAQALVGTKPMGAAQDAALQNAIDMPVATGAELKAKIAALEAAVVAANAWVGEYNNAKISLVTALERFEADYNNAQNGALNHMNKDRWAYAVEMAQAAAVAKDVTDSYEGFESAAGDLNDALDAATVSINEYASLKAAIDEANTLYAGDDWGNEPFQKPESVKEGLNTAKATAQTAYDVAEVEGGGVTALIESLNTTVNGVVLNAPEEGQRFYIKVATEGHGKNGNAWLMTLGKTGDNNRTGYGINANNAVQPHLNQAFIFTQVEGSNLYNISIERAEGTVYLTYGALNGSAAGWKNQQIQATTDEGKKGEFKIVPTGKNGVLKIFNTIDNNYLDCQDGGSIYTDTGISNEEFAFELASEHEVTLSISAARWATLILPFDAELPDGAKAWSCAEADGEMLTLTEATSLKANTPYLMSGNAGEYYFSGYGLADKDSYTDGLFTGTYAEIAAPVGSYVLQKNNDVLGFYLVGETKPTVKAYRCYMTYKGAGAPMFRIGEDETTSIHNSEFSTQDSAVVYDLMGRKVNTLEKGGMYIVNGKKVIVK